MQEVFAAGGNPYGSSFVTGHTVTGPDEHALAVATYQGLRLARYANDLHPASFRLTAFLTVWHDEDRVVGARSHLPTG